MTEDLYGITNDRLDTVSNYNRCQPGCGRIWRRNPAQVTAVIRDGKVVTFNNTNWSGGRDLRASDRLKRWLGLRCKLSEQIKRQ